MRSKFYQDVGLMSFKTASAELKSSEMKKNGIGTSSMT